VNLMGQQYVIEDGEHRATVVEVGAGLQRYTHRGVDITGSYGENTLPPKGCGITLVPWPNRIRGGKYRFEGVDYQLPLTEPSAGNAIHGLGRWVRWALVDHQPAAVTLRLDVVPQNGYPFPVRVDVTYALHPEFGLTVTLAALNLASTRIPFGAGSHPYVATRGHALDDTNLQVPARELLVTDEKSVPIGTRSVDRGEYDFRRGKRLKNLRMDTGFTSLDVADGRGAAELRTRDGGARLWFDETYRFLQVFTVDALTPGQAAVAIEPMTCAPNAFNSGAGLIVLEPGGAWRGSWGIVPL
jgi:aldose 1-epimerase